MLLKWSVRLDWGLSSLVNFQFLTAFFSELLQLGPVLPDFQRMTLRDNCSRFYRPDAVPVTKPAVSRLVKSVRLNQ